MPAWIITTAIGTGEKGFAGDGGKASEALLNGPFDIAFDRAGNLYFSDTFNHRIRRVEAATGIISTIAGNGEAGYSGDGGPAIAAALNEPYGVAVDRAGNVYTADRLNRRVRRIDAALRHHHDAGRHRRGGIFRRWRPGVTGGSRRAERARLRPRRTRLYIADVADHRVRVVDLASGVIDTFAGIGMAEHGGDGGPAREARIFGARAVKVAPDGTVYILERQGSSLRAVDPATGIISTIAGTTGRGYSGDGGPAVAAVFDAPKEMALDRDGSLLIVDTENHAIRRIDRASGIVTTVVGGRQGGHGDGGPAADAGLDRPHGAVVGPDGAIYIGDTNNHRIRKVVRPV